LWNVFGEIGPGIWIQKTIKPVTFVLGSAMYVEAGDEIEHGADTLSRNDR
jgi:hypothetical protein